MFDKWDSKFQNPPNIYCRSFITFPHSILAAQLEKQYDNWICGKYINCFFEKYERGLRFIYTLYDDWSVKQNLMVYQSITLFKQEFKDWGIDLPSFLKICMKENVYPHRYCSEKIILCDDTISDNELFEYMLIGYDDNQKTYKFVGFKSNRDYTCGEISYSELERSIYQSSKDYFQIFLWKYTPVNEYKFPIKLIINELEEYVNSRSSGQAQHGDKFFGLEGCLMLGEYITKEPITMHIKKHLIRSFWEHKYFMAKRSKILYDKNFISYEIYLYSVNAETLAKNLLEDLNNISATEVYDVIKKIIDIEKTYIPHIIKSLKMFDTDNINI